MKVKQRLSAHAACFCFSFCAFLGNGFAQQHVDFSGRIAKYDTTFSGIGPEVYFLPPPKTVEELLDDRYAEKEIDSALVEDYVNRMRYYHRFAITGGGQVAAKYIPIAEAQLSSVEGKLLMAADQANSPQERNLLADVENRLAMEYVALGAVDLAVEFFEKAMQAKQTLGNVADWEVVAHNLSVTYEYLGQLDKANGLRQQLYDRAVKARNNSRQAEALMELALIKAKQGLTAEAERDIIRKAVPLFRRARNEAGRAEAFRMLADIYTLQHKYPEAQWFLVQAKSIVDREGLPDQLPEIIFNLAETKMHAGNPRVAIEEYKAADGLARKDHMVGMQLAIQDALGNLYHQAGDYDGAALALNRYDTLKNMLFKGEAPVDN
ncbi:tetratricopeptide repeat protein [Parapedobacter sp. DT-150]|uniref:tetratricopeptide repeat protein n=1 Tax=Parapedobacter sp. DT-150 TaxID=3396162 RepID=UPI003F1DEF2C